MTESLLNLMETGVEDVLVLVGSAKCSNQQLIMPNDHDGEIKICTCCTEYMAWKKNHLDECRKFQQYADRPFHYKICPEKQVTAMEQGE